MNTRRLAATLLSFAVAVMGCDTFGLPVSGAVYRDGGIIRGPQDKKRIAIVFTGHEFAEGGETILDALAKRGAKGSFFLTGDFLVNTNFTGLIGRIVSEGHYVGPHSDKHLLYCAWEGTNQTLVARGQFQDDVERNIRKIEGFGVKRAEIRYFLPAYEHFNAQIADWTKGLGLTLIDFTPGTRANADYTGEADKNFVSAKAIFDSIVGREQSGPDGLNGFILLLHLGAGLGRTDKFFARFGELLDYLTTQGYRFVRVDELLESTPALSPAPASEIFIRANQVGYRPKDAKIAIAFACSPLPDVFSVVALDGQKVVFEAKPEPISGATWGRFENHAELDFSAVKAPGRYILRVGESKSLPFEIRAEAYAQLPDELLEFMREQRCGYNPWLDAVCHRFDGRTAYGPLTNGTYLDARGGWHDAADLLKYLLTSGNATAQMLLTYDLLTARFPPPNPRTGQGTDSIASLSSPKGGEGRGEEVNELQARFPSPQPSPRSGGERESSTTSAPPVVTSDRFNALGQPGANGIPDLLDEARWGLDWMLKLHPAPDQLYHQVADDRDHVGRRLPQNDAVDYGWGKGGARVVYFADGQPQGLKQYKSESTGIANLAGRYAAAMGLAYCIWRDDPREKAYAARCLQAGKEVYELGRAHEGVQQGNSYGAPYRYAETTWADDMEWGAAELYRATHERRYLDEAIHYAALAGSESWMGKEQTGHYQYYPFMNAGHFRLWQILNDDAPEHQRLRETLVGYYREGIESCLRAGQKNPYHIGVPFIWCSNNLDVALVTQCLLYEWMTGDIRYRAFAARQRDWLLGRNPWGYAMFTGIGSVHPRDPHLMTMQLTGRPVRGGLVDGPVYERIFKSLKGVAISEPDPLAAFQGPAVYHDDNRDYSSDEPTMDGTASAILLWALCSRPEP